MPTLALAAEPDLDVELRWVDVTLTGAALAAVRDGSYVVSTSGTVSPRGGPSWSTTSPADAVHPLAHFHVQSGHEAGFSQTETQMQTSLELISSQGGQGTQSTQGGQGGKAQGRLKSKPVERVRSVKLTPRWQGPNAPVQLELSVMTPTADGQAEQHSTVQVPPGQWFTVARSGMAARAPEPGTYSTQDAAPQTVRELQVRIMQQR